MGVTVIHTLPGYAQKLKGQLGPVMQKTAMYLQSSAVAKINGDIPPENAPLTQAVKGGNKTLRDRGLLIGSIAPHSGQDWASAGTNVRCAKIQNDGGVITGKGKGLWLPAGAQTRTLYRKYNAQKPGELIASMKAAGYSFYRIKNIFCAKPKKGVPFMLFIIKKSITIPKRRFLYFSMQNRKYIAGLIRSAVHKLLGGK